MIDTVLVDVDDTLLDFTKGERVALSLAFAELGLPFSIDTPKVYHDINDLWWARYERGEVERAELLWLRFADLLSHYGIEADPKLLAKRYEANLVDQHDYVAGAKEFVERLRHSGYRVYAISNGNANVQAKRLDDSGLIRLLDDAFVSQAVGYHKPQKEFFEAVASRIPHFDPLRAVVIGDSLTSDIQGGRSAGITTVWFDRLRRPDSPLADYHTDSWDAVFDVIRSL